jgi:hypothetical protein
MSVQLNHTIVSCRDQARSAAFLAGILGLPPATRFGPFLVVQAAAACTSRTPTVTSSSSSPAPTAAAAPDGARITLTATARPPGDRPRYTRPMPPAPSRPRSRYGPISSGSSG